MNANRLALAALGLLLAACTSRDPLETRLAPIRSYAFNATVTEPAPDWRPGSHELVARSLGGFVLLAEHNAAGKVFVADDRRDCYFPRWINNDQFVYGPARNAQRLADGSVSESTDGLTVVTLIGSGKPRQQRLAQRGFAPRPAGPGRIAAQAANRMLLIDSKGHIEDFGEGFDIEPQPQGPGLAWRDRPAFSPDWWTGLTGIGQMSIRWRPGAIDVVPGAVEATWTRLGGVVCTVVAAEAPPGRPWWAGGSRLVHVPGPGAQAVTLREDARHPAAHPVADLLAWVSGDGGVWIGTLRPDGWSERIAEVGEQPRWSSDGLRLCWTEPAAGTNVPVIRVTVLAPR